MRVAGVIFVVLLFFDCFISLLCVEGLVSEESCVTHHNFGNMQQETPAPVLVYSKLHGSHERITDAHITLARAPTP